MSPLAIAQLSIHFALVVGTVLLMALGKLDPSHWMTVLALFVPSGLEAMKGKPGPPPPSPVSIVAASIMLYATGALAAQACMPPATPEAAEAAYTAEQLACVQKSSTREESRVCRAEVDRKWGVADAGKDDGP